jgi:hypothetical protein
MKSTTDNPIDLVRTKSYDVRPGWKWFFYAVKLVGLIALAITFFVDSTAIVGICMLVILAMVPISIAGRFPLFDLWELSRLTRAQKILYGPDCGNAYKKGLWAMFFAFGLSAGFALAGAVRSFWLHADVRGISWALVVIIILRFISMGFSSTTPLVMPPSRLERWLTRP